MDGGFRKDWMQMQMKSGLEVIELDKCLDSAIYKTIKKHEPKSITNWNESISAMYHVFTGQKWILATENQRDAFDIYKSLID